MKALIASCIVGLMMVTTYNLQAATTEVFHYRDEQGRAVFADHAMTAPQYKLIWRKSLARLDDRNNKYNDCWCNGYQFNKLY